jgi:hypothetical protein
MIELTPVAWLQARMTQARMNGTTYLRLRRDSPARAPAPWPLAPLAAVSSISCSSASAASAERDRRSAARASAILPFLWSHRGDSVTMKLPMTNTIPGGSDTQKMLRHAVSLKAMRRAGSPSLATSATRKLKYMPMNAAETMPSVRSHWKIPVPLPRLEAPRHSAR